MNTIRKAYLANIGMITPTGYDASMTATSVRAKISSYQVSEYMTPDNKAATMSGVPEVLFDSFALDIDEGEYYSDMYDRMIKMAIISAQEALSSTSTDSSIPLILALPEPIPGIKQIPQNLFLKNLLNREGVPLSLSDLHVFHTGRSGVIHALELAIDYLYNQNKECVLVGGSDSYWHLPLIHHLAQTNRVLTKNSKDGFVPGEGAGFLLLTKDKNKALNVDGQVIVLHEPGLAKEAGHMFASEPNRGDGLDAATKAALSPLESAQVKKIYSSMNGESFWSKELGVAIMRSSAKLDEDLDIEHPADCYGDIGAASGAVLTGIAALDLLKNPAAKYYMVQCSSDGPWRSALLLEKEPIEA
ncbi:beta-ketoacyl synthase N-terminal-like domain-containing protein [Aliikangiella coralliicola]|uniref:Beta-ketoacyl synthase-like N-terminal domain-containing protein n=1 Tax=Aliikangiella coralliicola TaxID=2592383 RepID=A0A545UEX9_9GAMM|nr:beta-ketoacyl synthase N-terminal-like domain-containing protein [Aliikangiella coralliicola]TQV88042.1 hypothetical protein FLL46_09545 [Aliikangiella coralliicola]